MSSGTIKRLAADILKVGVNRVRIRQEDYARAMEALTREDVRGLIEDGVVYRIRYVGRRTKPPRKRKGAGKRKGRKYSRKGAKESWMERLRSQREYLGTLLREGELSPQHKRAAYLKVKGGSFRGKAALKTYLEENGMLTEGKASPAKTSPGKKGGAKKPKKEGGEDAKEAKPKAKKAAGTAGAALKK